MADKKISALTGATTPLAGTEVLPIVQGGSTVKVSVANLTAGRSIATNDIVASGELTSTTNNARISLYRSAGTNYFDWASGQTLAFGTQTSQGGAGRVSKVNFLDSGDVTNVTGNFVVGTAGKGIDFSANGGDVLTQYDQGTWTVKLFDAGGGGNQSATTVTGYYTRIGNLVHCAFSGLNNISTAGMTAGNNLYIELPFTAASTGIGTGSFASENIDFNGRSNATPVVTNSAGRAILRAYGSATSSATVLVSNVGAGANIDYFSVTYRV